MTHVYDIYEKILYYARDSAKYLVNDILRHVGQQLTLKNTDSLFKGAFVQFVVEGQPC